MARLDFVFFSTSVGTFLSVLTVVCLLTVTWGIWKGYWLQKKKRQAQKNRLIKSKSHALSRLRFFRSRHFCRVADSITDDVHDLLFREGGSRYEARTLLPLVVEALQFGERLLAERRRHHVLLHSKVEREIEQKMAQLLLLEDEIKTIPRAAFTIEEVVAGKFTCIS